MGVEAGVSLACSQDLRVSGSSVGAQISQAHERQERQDREQRYREEVFKGNLERSVKQGAQIPYCVCIKGGRKYRTGGGEKNINDSPEGRGKQGLRQSHDHQEEPALGACHAHQVCLWLSWV